MTEVRIGWSGLVENRCNTLFCLLTEFQSANEKDCYEIIIHFGVENGQLKV